MYFLKFNKQNLSTDRYIYTQNIVSGAEELELHDEIPDGFLSVLSIQHLATYFHKITNNLYRLAKIDSISVESWRTLLNLLKSHPTHLGTTTFRKLSVNCVTLILVEIGNTIPTGSGTEKEKVKDSGSTDRKTRRESKVTKESLTESHKPAAELSHIHRQRRLHVNIVA